MATNTKNYQDGSRMLGNAARTGASGAKAAWKTASFAASHPVIALILAVAIFLIIVVVVALPAGGIVSSSFDKNAYYTAIDEENDNAPDNAVESLSAIWDKRQSLIATADLAEIINKNKDKQKEKIASEYGKDVSEVVCESDQAPYYITGYDEIDSAGGASGGGEGIAQTAEKFAYKENEGYDYDSGVRGTPAMHAARDKYHPDWSDYKYACCCHSTGLILSEACDKPVGSLLPNTNSAASAKADIEKKLKGLGFEVFPYDGKGSSLQRGDVLSYNRKGGGGHVYIYLGKNTIVEGSRTNNWFSHYNKCSSMNEDVSKYHYYYVMRRTGGSSGVTSSGSSEKAYTSLTTIETIKRSAGSSKALEPAGSWAYQSMAYNNGTYYFLRPPHGKTGSNGYIMRYNESMELQEATYGEDYGHGNGFTYCTEDNKLYSATTKSCGNNKKLGKIDPDSLKLENHVDVSNGCSAVGYDSATKKFVTASGRGYWKINVYSSSLKKEKSFKQLRDGGTPGDICVHNGIVYVCRFMGSADNYIDMYDINTEEYYGSYHYPYNELEGIIIDKNDQIVLLVHASRPYVHFTGVKALKGTGGGGQDYSRAVTQHDLDIISAYNVSISNSGLYKQLVDDEKDTLKKDKNSKSGYSLSYSSVKNTPIKTYRFGKKKGQINYKADLKAKLKTGFLARATGTSIDFYEVLKGQKAVTAMKEDGIEDKVSAANGGTGVASVTQPGDWKLTLVNNNNAVPSGWDAKPTAIRNGEVHKKVVDPLEEMLSACEAAGYSPMLLSWYRTREYQEKLYNNAANKDDTAKPGHSEHELGLAVDIVEEGYEEKWNHAWDDAEATEDEPVIKWLMENCTEYGFILRYPKGKKDETGIVYEPWHFRFVGKKNAKKIKESGLTLDEYVTKLTGGEKQSVRKSQDEDVIYLRERPIADILDDMGLPPDEEYSGATYHNEIEGEIPFDATNLGATLAISDNTAKFFYIGMKDKEVESDTNLIAGGKLAFPVKKEGTLLNSVYTNGALRQDLSTGRPHTGIDFAGGGAANGQPVYASHAGKVTAAGYHLGYGYHVDITLGKMTTRYGHMQNSLKVSKGDTVRAGQQIGVVGSTGFSTGAHLHFEVLISGKWVDPCPYLGLKNKLGPVN